MTGGALRKNLRFNADENDVVWISKELGKFSEDVIALLDTESYSGFSMVVLRDRGIKVGDELFIKVGHFSPTTAVVCWTKDLGQNVYRFGLEYTSD